MKDLKSLISEKFGDNKCETIVLTPTAVEALLKFIKGKEDKGVCLSYEWNSDDEWSEIGACFYDERNDKGPSNWPWKKIWSEKSNKENIEI